VPHHLTQSINTAPITITGDWGFSGFCTKVKRKCKNFTIFIFSLFSFGFVVSVGKAVLGKAVIGRLDGLGICDHAGMKGKFEP